MPTYLLHGFRWPRALIRIHIILQNLEDAAAEWLMAPNTVEAMTRNFKTCYPGPMSKLPNLQFIEQYDPMDERPEGRLQPYAYVADVVHEIRLGTDLKEIVGTSLGPSPTFEALSEVRDALAGDHEMPEISWFVVVCGDTERPAPVDMDDFTAQASIPAPAMYPSTPGNHALAPINAQQSQYHHSPSDALHVPGSDENYQKSSPGKNGPASSLLISANPIPLAADIIEKHRFKRPKRTIESLSPDAKVETVKRMLSSFKNHIILP